MIDQKLPITTHVRELRIRLIYSSLILFISFLICYNYALEIYQFLLKPLLSNNQYVDQKIIYTNLSEVFFSYIKLAFFAASFISFPYFLIQLYIFMAPGLYKQEKLVMIPYLIFIPVLFIAGALFVYYFIIPIAWNFFLSFEVNEIGKIPIKLEAKVSEYLSLIMHLIIAFGLAFELPVLLILLVHINIIDTEKLKKFRRWSIVIIFTIAAIITPPDAISQISLAIPMIMLYEIAIFIGKIIENKRNKKCLM